jgi:secondary thiamine-phosphate synthase enzyme
MLELSLKTDRRTKLIEITELVRDSVAGATGSAALVYVPHTTAGIAITEKIDPVLIDDLERAYQRVVADEWEWNHEDEDGPNAPSHARASLASSPQVLIPLRDGELALGTYQGIFFCEFDGPRDRRVFISVLA